jgi:ATP-dependent DNA helicase RecG
LYERENPAYRFDKTVIKEYKGGVDKKTLKWFLSKARDKRNIPDTQASNDILLQNIGAYTKGQLNLGGMLTFGKNIQPIMPNAMIKCAVFEGLDKTGRILDHVEIKENVFASIDRAEQFILRNLRKSAWINPKTGRRDEQYEIPYLAIREAVANAVAHRDYKISATVDVAIFDDRVEVWSPGELPLGVTLENFRSKKKFSVLRNPVVSEALFLAGYIEKWGTGISKMNTLMEERGLPIPEYEEIESAFIVTFRKSHMGKTTQKIEKSNEKSNEKGKEKSKEKILKVISKNSAITAKELAESIGLSVAGVEKNIRLLKKEGKLVRKGPDKGGHWEIKKR